MDDSIVTATAVGIIRELKAMTRERDDLKSDLASVRAERDRALALIEDMQRQFYSLNAAHEDELVRRSAERDALREACERQQEALKALVAWNKAESAPHGDTTFYQRVDMCTRAFALAEAALAPDAPAEREGLICTCDAADCSRGCSVHGRKPR